MNSLNIFRVSKRGTLKTHSRSALFVFVLALLVRLLLFGRAASDTGNYFLPDSREYHKIAVNLVQGNGFSLALQAPFTPDLRRTPLYPSFMALIYGLLGMCPEAVILFQCVLGAALAAGVYVVGCRWMNEKAAFAAGILMSIDPVSVCYANLLLTETLFASLLFAGVILLLDSDWRQQSRYWAISGMLFGLATLCRPVGVLLLPVVLLAVLGMGKIRARIGYRLPLIWAGVFALVLVPWLVRSVRVAGQPILSTIGAYNLVAYRTAGIRAEVGDKPLVDARQECLREAARDLDGRIPAGSAVRMFAKEALGHPVTALRITIVEFAGFFLYPERSALLELLGIRFEKTPNYPGEKAIFMRLQALFHAGWAEILLSIVQVLFMMAVCAYAMAAWWRLRHLHAWMTGAVILIVVFALIHAGPEMTARFRVPMMPFLGLLAAFGMFGKEENNPEALPNVTNT